ncbi:MAG: hemerythrin domain-containing protein [Magnetovibrio sp.]|nr:hemerythrin domain-containing protein [Magnetovibrio sp.]
MSQLVDALKAEHANIARILGRVVELGIETEEGRKTLMAAKTGLLAHLEREDKHLYPVLLEAARDDDIIADALGFLHEDIVGVSEAALRFFDKYGDGPPGDEFADDFQALAGALTQRIQKEESVIYKMAENIDFLTDGAP